MERSITINSLDSNLKAKASKYNYIDPNATDQQIYNAAVAMMSLSDNSFVSVTVTDSYKIEPTNNSTNNNRQATFNSTFRK